MNFMYIILFGKGIYDLYKNLIFHTDFIINNAYLYLFLLYSENSCDIDIIYPLYRIGENQSS